MKKHPLILSLAILGSLALVALTVSRAAVEPLPASFQYVTLRASSPTQPYVLRQDGKVELYGPRLARENPPQGADTGAYFMNLTLNLLGKEGYEFAGITDCGIVLKRAERR